MIGANDLLAMEIKEIPMLVENLIPKVGIAVIGGSSDTGKSSFLRDLVLSIVETKDTFLDQTINAIHNSAVYVSTEDDDTAIACLLQKCIGYQNYDDYSKLMFLFERNNLLSTLDTYLTDKPVDVIVMDCYADLFSGDINSTTATRNFLDPYTVLANKHKCCIFFLHHVSKAKDNANSGKSAFIGSQGFEAKSRVAIILDKEAPSGHRRMRIVKGNYLSEEQKKRNYIINFREDQRFELASIENATSSTSSTSSSLYEQVIGSIVTFIEDDGLTYERICEELLLLGHSVSTSSIGNYYARYKSRKTVQVSTANK